ncbi:MAG: hypothetical protein IPK76_06095 [Lewinellaceae bacterium]|nr:hypothetical protein [Lewinellaceae bacterium]
MAIFVIIWSIFFSAWHTGQKCRSSLDMLSDETRPQRERIWQKNYGGVKFNSFDAMASHNDGYLLMAGQTLNFSDSTGGDIYLVKTDTAGNLTWQKQSVSATIPNDAGTWILPPMKGMF